MSISSEGRARRATRDAEVMFDDVVRGDERGGSSEQRGGSSEQRGGSSSSQAPSDSFESSLTSGGFPQGDRLAGVPGSLWSSFSTPEGREASSEHALSLLFEHALSVLFVHSPSSLFETTLSLLLEHALPVPERRLSFSPCRGLPRQDQFRGVMSALLGDISQRSGSASGAVNSSSSFIAGRNEVSQSRYGSHALRLLSGAEPESLCRNEATVSSDFHMSGSVTLKVMMVVCLPFNVI
mmetsp:Transcript_18082/g.42592  ORF Transcript_18082/g.42592 Transcript_18082/m.42592 type:complete len:238 (-) Transcript_18082:1491-2204(-)